MYSLILESELNNVEKREAEDVTRTLAAVISLRARVTVEVLGRLLGIGSDRVRDAIHGLQSLLYVSKDSAAGYISTFHASLGDYLVDTARSGGKPWHIDIDQAHLDLCCGCLRILDEGLKFNISGYQTSHLHNDAQSERTTLPEELIYSCQYWVDHFLVADAESAPTEKVLSLLTTKMLFWIEAMSTYGSLPVLCVALRKLRIRVSSVVICYRLPESTLQ
jgi:hypothetical protein